MCDSPPASVRPSNIIAVLRRLSRMALLPLYVLAVFVLYVLFLLSLPWLGMLLGGIAFVFAVQTVIGN